MEIKFFLYGTLFGWLSVVAAKLISVLFDARPPTDDKEGP